MKIFNSLTQKLEEFKPLNNNRVTIYVCGITPYDTTHLGHAFTYISFDALIRYLKFKGFNVIYTQNVTDINDRDKDILQRAKEQNISWQKLSEFWTEKFLSDMKCLNWISPTNYLKASENIPAMLNLIQKLLDNSLGYIVNGSVYLDISKVSGYGKLSKLFDREKMIKVAKDFEEDLENPDKRNPLDITLWRASKPNDPKHIPSFAFDSKGLARHVSEALQAGRPGWHIECSAMSISTLGEQIDIHGGGSDLKFPHHEAEIAQSEGATGKIPFAKYWLHTGTVGYRGQKMSKSKGNLVMVSDLLKKYSQNAIRWLILSHHWHEDWEFKEEDLARAQKNVELVENLNLHLRGGGIKEFTRLMDNNLDTPKTLEYLLNLVEQNSKVELKKLYNILGFI